MILKHRFVRGLVATSLIAASVNAAAQSATLNVSATLQEGCQIVNSNAALNFGAFVPLQDTDDRVASTGSTFQIRCTANATPKLYATGLRKLTNGGAGEINFSLSRSSGASADDLPASMGSAISILEIQKNGEIEDLVLHGRIPKNNFLGKPGGAYSAQLVLNLTY